MSLVNYSSSDEQDSCSEETHEPTTNKSTDRNTLNVSKKSRMQDIDDSNTECRARSFAHERGNWATFVYVPFSFNDSVHDLQHRIVNNFENDGSLKLHLMKSLHVSLSRTVVLQHHWIEAFTKSIKECFTDFKKFTLNLNTLNVYCNDECTTTFVAIAVTELDCEPLKAMVAKFDNCLGEYNLPFFYEDASFHVSILWCVGDRKSRILKEIEKLQQFLDESILDDYQDYQINVNQIECKVGNKVYFYPLRT